MDQVESSKSHCRQAVLSGEDASENPLKYFQVLSVETTVPAQVGAARAKQDNKNQHQRAATTYLPIGFRRREPRGKDRGEARLFPLLTWLMMDDWSAKVKMIWGVPKGSLGARGGSAID